MVAWNSAIGDILWKDADFLFGMLSGRNKKGMEQRGVLGVLQPARQEFAGLFDVAHQNNLRQAAKTAL